MTVNQERGLAMSIETDHFSAQAAFRSSGVNGLLWSASPGPSPWNQANLAPLETPFDLRIPCRSPAVLNLTPDRFEGPPKPKLIPSSVRITARRHNPRFDD